MNIYLLIYLISVLIMSLYLFSIIYYKISNFKPILSGEGNERTKPGEFIFSITAQIVFAPISIICYIFYWSIIFPVKLICINIKNHIIEYESKLRIVGETRPINPNYMLIHGPIKGILENELKYNLHLIESRRSFISSGRFDVINDMLNRIRRM